MDPFGSQDLDVDGYLIAQQEEFEFEIVELPYGDVLVLETRRGRQFPGPATAGGGSGGASSSITEVSDLRNGLSDRNYFNNDGSHQAQQLNHMYMQNEDQPTWLGNYPHHDNNTPLQQPAPHTPSHHIHPIAAAVPPPAASSPELVPLPPSLENPPPRASTSSFYNYFTSLLTARVASPPRPTVMESSEFPFSHVGNIPHVSFGGSETGGTTQKVTGVTSAAPEQTVNTSDGASKGTGEAAPPPVEDRKGKRKIETVEVDDDSEIRASASTKRPSTETPKPKKISTAKMANQTKKQQQRRRSTNDRFNTLFHLTPNCEKGSRNRDDKMDKVVSYMRALIYENEILRQRQQMFWQPPYGMMHPPPSATPATPAPAAAAGPSTGPAFPAPPADPEAYVTITLVEYQQLQALRQMQHLPPAQPQNEEAGQPGGSNIGSEES